MKQFNILYNNKFQFKTPIYLRSLFNLFKRTQKGTKFEHGILSPAAARHNRTHIYVYFCSIKIE